MGIMGGMRIMGIMGMLISYNSHYSHYSHYSYPVPPYFTPAANIARILAMGMPSCSEWSEARM
jgi:hypothetical protein